MNTQTSILKAIERTMKKEPATLSDSELDTVTGGSAMSMLFKTNPSDTRYAEGYHCKLPGLMKNPPAWTGGPCEFPSGLDRTSGLNGPT
jgi:hypothetical protein